MYQDWSYLASVLDFTPQGGIEQKTSGQIVGWSLPKQPNTELVQNAIDNTVARHKPDTNDLMFHSD